ncbi:gem-associated protein 2-like [Tubulanus polymorphus]|uniref:gem-associated protein 2-like n=1 Tax=Tubulanus polymorphus TaxID=672921 RepID=UPI003DA40F96
MSDIDDSSSLLGRAAFPIEPADDDEDYDLDIPPTSGQQYLKRVLLEAQSIPGVVVARVDPASLKKPTITIPKVNDCPAPPQGFAPSLLWQHQQTADFSNIRQMIVHFKATNKNVKPNKNLPHKENAEEWCRLCFGRLIVKNGTNLVNESPQSSAQLADGTPPLMSIVAAMNQPTVLRVLEYHLKWLEATGFTEQQGRWFYALLASLEKPLIPEACSIIRSLARMCAHLRTALSGPEDPKLVHLNLLVCLVARYFDQMDLADKG